MPGRLLRRRGLLTFASLVLVAEVAGRSLTADVDRRLHLQPLARPDASYYPFLLVAAKIVSALALAALLARGTRAWAAADAGRRLLTAVGHQERRAPRLRRRLSARIWLASFASTSVLYLVHADVDGIARNHWNVFAPWLHTDALPVFAVLAVLIAALWRVASWLYEVEEFAARAFARVRRILGTALLPPGARPHADEDHAPRRRFGLAFECRPPPAAV